MNTGTATAIQRPELDAGAAFALIETYRISLTPAFDGRVWFASSDVLGTAHNKARAIDSIEAQASTSLGAVAALARLLEQEQKPLCFDGEG